MSLSINPGLTYQVSNIASQRAIPVESRRDTVVPETEESSTDRSARRSESYIAALRELRAEQQNQATHPATRTYLQIAHYEGNFQLVDVYT